MLASIQKKFHHKYPKCQILNIDFPAPLPPSRNSDHMKSHYPPSTRRFSTCGFTEYQASRPECLDVCSRSQAQLYYNVLGSHSFDIFHLMLLLSPLPNRCPPALRGKKLQLEYLKEQLPPTAFTKPTHKIIFCFFVFCCS